MRRQITPEDSTPSLRASVEECSAPSDIIIKNRPLFNGLFLCLLFVKDLSHLTLYLWVIERLRVSLTMHEHSLEAVMSLGSR